jgi:hypothetical protein
LFEEPLKLPFVVAIGTAVACYSIPFNKEKITGTADVLL